MKMAPYPQPLPKKGGEPSPPTPLPKGEGRIPDLKAACYAAMNDDFNSPMVIASLFEAVRIINSVNDKKEAVSGADLVALKELFDVFLFDILGIKNEKEGDDHEVLDGLMQLVLAIRQKSRETKDWGTSDQIRDALQQLHITVKDGKDGSSWDVG